jgi:hypothetical protein
MNNQKIYLLAEHRRLASELESHGSEILRSGSDYCCADFGSTRIDRVIKRQGLEAGELRGSEASIDCK